MSVLSLSYWESNVYWRQNNKHFAELAPQNGGKQLIWRNYVTVTLYILFNKRSAVAEMGERLATIDMGGKLGPAVPLFRGGTGSPSNTMWPGPRPAYLRTKWHLDPSSRLTTTDMGPKIGAVPLFRGGSEGGIWVPIYADFSGDRIPV